MLKPNQLRTLYNPLNLDKIEVKDGVYGFYIDPEDWEDLPETLMRTEFKNASTYALIKEGKFFVANANWNDYIKVMNNVKILSCCKTC